MGRTDDYMRAVQDDDTPTVTFPDDYPNSVRHFLLIGFLGMFIGAIVFFYMGISRKVNTVMHVLTFFVASTLATSFFGGYPQLAQHSENVKENEQLFLEHGNLAGEMRTFAVTQRGRSEDGQESVADLSDFIHYVDRRLAAMNHIPLEFDASAVNLGAEKFMELQPE